MSTSRNYSALFYSIISVISDPKFTCTKITRGLFKKEKFLKVSDVQQVFAYIIVFRKFWFPERVCKLKRRNPVFAP